MTSPARAAVKLNVIRYYMSAANTRPPISAHSYHHGDLRAALVRAALAQVERDGPEAVSLSALAKALGVSQPAPYRHFADREALLAAVAAEGFLAFAAAMRAATRGAPVGEQLGRLARAYVAFARERIGLYRLMFATRIVANAAPGDPVGQAANEAFAVLLTAIEAGGPAPDTAREGLGAWATVHGIVMLEREGLLQGGTMGGVTVDALIDDVVARRGSR